MFTVASTLLTAPAVADPGNGPEVPSAGAPIAIATNPDVTPTFNGAVRTVAYHDGVAFVGGDFTAAYVGNRAFARGHLAAINARTGELMAWNPEADDKVNALAVANNIVFAAGSFYQINGVRRIHLAGIHARTGELWQPLQPRIEGPVFALAAGLGSLYVAGRIASVDGQTRDGAAAFSLQDGKLRANWAPVTDGRVESLAVGHGRVYLSGKFHTINGRPGTAFVGAVDPYRSRVDRRFNARMGTVVHAVGVGGRQIFLGTGGSGGQLVAMEATGRIRWRLTADGDVQAVSVLPHAVVFGGHFDNACRSERTGNHGACLDGAVRRVKVAGVAIGTGRLLPWAPDANGIEGVLSITADVNLRKVAIGGNFTAVQGTPQRRFAQFSLR
jgi:hypothetical protein